MSFPRYPKYKPSGVEWLGEVPDDWHVDRLSNVCKFQSGKAHEQFIDDDGEFICVNSRFVSTEGTSRKYCTQNFSPAKKDDILMVMSDLPNGRALAKAFFVSDENPYAVNQRVCILSAYEDDPKFLFYLLNRNPLFLLHDDGINQTHLSNAVFTKFPTVRPPISQQHTIASFLDRETSKIDGLVGEQRRLIELLKEKRQAVISHAVISHAVTKGLNPHAPLKPSGIEWLGDVPEGWHVPLLQRVVESADLGGDYEASEGDDGIPLIKMGNLSRGVMDTTTFQRLPRDADYDRSLCLKFGDFLFNTRNSLELVGKVAIWRNELPEAIYNSNILRLRFKSAKVSSSAFMNYFFNADIGLSQLRLIAKGTTSVAAIYYKDLTTIRIVLPTPAEQIAIAERLDDACAQLDALTAEAERGIELLQERRTALISAAVTGKIDVRGLVAS